MALIDCKFFSETLGQCATMHVLLPQHTTRQIGLSGVQQEGPPKVLYLLHGLSDDHSIWLRRTSIERYVAETGWAVVMPAVHRSFYCNLPNGLYYFDFVADELPALCRQFFGFSSARDRNYVAGLSMGGYGAMKVGLTYPERYQAVASLSGCLDIVAT